MTKTTGNFTDFVSFSRASGGTALRRISYGSELVTNGTFDTDTSGWTAYKGAGLSVVSGKLRVTNGVSGRGGAGQAIPTVVGKVYTLTLDGIPSPNSTQVFAYVGSALGSSSIAYLVNTNGTGLRLNFVAQGSETWITVLPADTTTGDYNDFDNISVKEVLFDRADGTLQLFNHPTNVPRVEYDASGNLKGLLIEEARTNYRALSQALDFSGFTSNTGGSVSLTGSQLDPNGGTTGFLLAGMTTSNDYRSLTGTGAVTAGQVWTGSIWVKGTSGQIVGTRVARDGTATFESTVNQATLTGDWQRIHVSHTFANSHTGARVDVGWFTTTGTNAASVLIAWCQLEIGAFPTSYIPTSGATATRAADICSIATSAFGYNQGAGTIVVDVAEFKFGTSGFPRAVEIGNSSNNGERINVVVAAASGTYSAGLNTANVFQMGGTLASSISSPFVPSKVALAYKTNDGAAAYGGVIKSTDTSIDVVGTSYPRNTLKIGGSTTAVTDQINGHIKSIRYFPRRLTNTQIQALTA